MAAQKRRDNGLGSVSQRKDGTWTARVTVGRTPDGKQKVKAVYARTEREAKSKLRELLKDIARGELDSTQKSTVAMFMRDWLYNNRRNVLKPKSFDRLEQTIEYHVLPYIGFYQIGALKSSDVQQMVNSLRDKGYAYSTIKKAYDAVNACFKAGIAQRIVTFNPAQNVTVPSKAMFDPHEIRFYTKEELFKIYEAARFTYQNGARKYRLGDFVILDVNTGLRFAELLALRWSDIDLDERILSVRNTRVRVKDRDGDDSKYVMIEQKSTKTATSTRKMILNDDAYNALLSLKEVTGDFEFVLSTQEGKPIGDRYLDKTFRNILKTAGFPDEKIYGIHSLRHTFASLLFANGVDVKTVSELLGHSDTTITYNTYIHLIQEQKNEAVKRIANFMSDVEPDKC